ncbi:hypothetical protein BXP70_26730 [Hymenobacter crusticola]|uniref:Uncharacterized protein n=1 Tax=Hymenobacter crusticola TaxID=1770526 RepID=A0A243W8B2_9BACT|nr:hypothetical protein BXP70_26730 [Hymenobacter crusticola]
MLVPPPVVTVTGPVVAPVGTVAVRVAALTTLNVAATPLKKRTAVALLRLVPVRVTLVPTGPLLGLMLVSVGAANTVVFRNTLAVVNVPALLPSPATKSSLPSLFKSPMATS